MALALATTLFAFGPAGGPLLAGPGFTGPPGSAFGSPGAFGPGPEGPGRLQGGPGPAFPGGIDPARLNLSKEQLSKMRAMADRFFQETRDLRYEVLQKELEMRKLFTDPKVDDATLLAKQKELSTLHLKLMDRSAQLMIEARKILTPEQIQELDRMPMGHDGMGPGRR
jgi:Spy/CpxP family protein refolding chaperone